MMTSEEVLKLVTELKNKIDPTNRLVSEDVDTALCEIESLIADYIKDEEEEEAYELDKENDNGELDFNSSRGC